MEKLQIWFDFNEEFPNIKNLMYFKDKIYSKKIYDHYDIQFGVILNRDQWRFFLRHAIDLNIIDSISITPEKFIFAGFNFKIIKE